MSEALHSWTQSAHREHAAAPQPERSILIPNAADSQRESALVACSRGKGASLNQSPPRERQRRQCFLLHRHSRGASGRASEAAGGAVITLLVPLDDSVSAAGCAGAIGVAAAVVALSECGCHLPRRKRGRRRRKGREPWIWRHWEPERRRIAETIPEKFIFTPRACCTSSPKATATRT